jgi:prepilin-type N-terminal cleavage/methylation domain-containing protein
MNRRGLTLIETIMGLAVIGIAFALLAAIFMNLAPRTAQVEAIEKKSFLAQEKMEEWITRTYAQTATGESSGAFSGAFAGYNYKVIVAYVSAATLDAAVAGPTSLKNVKVRVWGGQVNPGSSVEVVTVVSSYDVH